MMAIRKMTSEQFDQYRSTIGGEPPALELLGCELCELSKDGSSRPPEEIHAHELIKIINDETPKTYRLVLDYEGETSGRAYFAASVELLRDLADEIWRHPPSGPYKIVLTHVYGDQRDMTFAIEDMILQNLAEDIPSLT